MTSLTIKMVLTWNSNISFCPFYGIFDKMYSVISSSGIKLPLRQKSYLQAHFRYGESSAEERGDSQT